jgi:hypothetical protein
VREQVRADSTAPTEQLRFYLLSGIVEAANGPQDRAERDLRAALELSEKELPRQPADRVEIYLRLAKLLAVSHREREASDVARQGLRCAESSYGAFFAQHPFVAALRNIDSNR